MLARLFVLIGGMIVLALTAVLVAPYLIDWTSYRADFEREASRILGRQVTVAGEATARILPFPSVTFSNVEVAGDSPGVPILTAETFSMDAELAPFMRGEILIFDMRLVKPRAIVNVAENGSINWTVRPNTPLDPKQIELEKISVVDGEVLIRHGAGEREHVVSDLDAVISARTLAGPWRMNGSLAFDDQPLVLSASTGTVNADGSMRLRIEANPDAYPVAVETDGDVRLVDGAAIYSGMFHINAVSEKEQLIKDSDEKVFNVVIEDDTKEDSLAYRINGTFSFDHRLIGIDEFRFETGPESNPYFAEGSAYLDFGPEPRFSIQAEGQQVRLDLEGDRNEDQSAMPMERRIAAFREAVKKLPRPRIPGIVEFDLPAIVAGDTTIRQVSLSAQPEADGWQIGAFSALLPGRATLEANGFLATGNNFGFHGSMLLAVKQPSGFAAWLSEDVDEAIRRLPAAGFSAEVDISDQRQTFRNLELILGDARFTGEIDHHLSADARPSMLLRLDGGALDLDGLAAFASIFVDDSGAARFDEHNLDFAIKAGPVTAGGITVGGVDTALRLKDGRLDIDRLSVTEIAGATLSATGKIHGFPESPTGNLDASIVAVDLAPLVRLLAARYPNNRLLMGLAERVDTYPALLRDANIDLVATAAANDDGSIGLALSANGVAGGSNLTISGSATTRDRQFIGPLSFSAAIGSMDAAWPFAAYGMPAIDLGLTGAVETTLSIKGEIGDEFDVRAGLRGGATRVTFTGRAKPGDDDLSLGGRAKIVTDDAEPWLATAGVSLPEFGLGIPAELAFDLDYEEEQLAVVNLAGKVSDRSVSGNIKVGFGEAVPDVSGEISAGVADLSMLYEFLLGKEAMPEGETGWADTPFAANTSMPVTGDLKVRTDLLRTGLGVPFGDVAVDLVVGSDSIVLSNLSGRLGGGRIKGLIELRNSAGTGLLSAQIKLADAHVSAGNASSGFDAVADVAANITASGKSLTGLVSALSGSGTVALKSPVVRGIDPKAFPDILAAADEIGKDVADTDISDFAVALIGNNAFSAADTEFAFVVAAGDLRTPTVEFRHPNARLRAEVKIDLAAETVEGNGEIIYDPGREGLVGAEPVANVSVSGPVRSPVLSYDTEPLARYLTQRALEIEQYRVEALQAGLLEKQRLRREVQYFASLADERHRFAEGEARRQRESKSPQPLETPAGDDAGTIDPGDIIKDGLDGEAIIRVPLPSVVEPEARDERGAPSETSDRAGVESHVFEELSNDKMTIEDFLKSLKDSQ